jgi:hypothetical protein
LPGHFLGGVSSAALLFFPAENRGWCRR